MRLQFAAAPILLAWSCHFLPGVDISWLRQPGLALHIASNASGSLWVIGTEEVVSGNYSIHRYLGSPGSEWRQEPGSGRRLAVDPKGDVWMVNAQNNIYRYRTETTAWERLPGLATDIAAGADGSVWVIGIVSVAGGYPIYKWNGNDWTRISGGALRIAVEKDGSPWVVNDIGNVYRYNLQANSWETKQTGTGRSVHTGAASGAVWVIGRESIAGGYPIQQWNAANNAWEVFGTYGAVAVTEAKGTPWIVQADGEIFSQGVALIQTGPEITINPQLPSGPVMPPLLPGPDVPVILPPTASGKMLCSVADAGSLTHCGDTKADYVGEYKLDTTCDKGFYDLVYGGTCWECPSDSDDGGAWIRSADSVEKDTACWRAPKEKLTSAIKARSPAWPWDCPSGSFWDGYSPDGIGGSCWRCPDTHPRRTGNHVSSAEACATPANQTAPAKLISFNGCPKPDKETMSLPGKRSPGKPFLDIGAGWSQGVASGGCYACPAVDEQGNFLITARNGDSISNKDNNTGCRINFKYQPAAFPEPGLSGLGAVREVIWENRLFEGDRITEALYVQAVTRDHKTLPEAQTWVTAQWKEVSTRPYNNQAFRLHIFALLKAALAKTATVRTPGEQMLIKSFEEYILRRRTYLAEQALAMYDAWKKYSDAELAKRAQSQLETLFYYGTVPLDFNASIGGTMALGGTASGLVGAMVAAQSVRAGIQASAWIESALGPPGSVERAANLYQTFSKPLNLIFKGSSSGFAAVSGASIIAVVGAILSSVAMEQFYEIQTARSKLEASLALAKKPVSLDDLYKETNGEDLLYYYWGKAMDTSDGEDQQVVSAAAAAHAYAQQKGYKP